MSEPTIIQGGMGAGVSSWTLASAVAKAGQLGVVAGTALDVILARRLQVGDPGGHMRRALAQFPVPDVARRILDKFFVEGGKDPDTPFRPIPLLSDQISRESEELMVAANFAEVYLAKEGHDGQVGINYLEKIQTPTLPSIYGAMLAGVGYVLMGAGIPRAIPNVLDRLAAGQAVELRLDVKGAMPGDFIMSFDPASYVGSPSMTRPKFLAIISSVTMGTMMVRKASGKVDGLIVEGPSAGGHNAPPRGKMQITENGEPIYGDRDVTDIAGIRKLGVPFWLAGLYATPERVKEALAEGATGVQIGTAFAYSKESGLDAGIKQRVLEMSRDGTLEIHTDAVASPTGFPFKVLRLPETVSEKDVYEERKRVCDLGYLRHAYVAEEGKLGWRCPSEPTANYAKKGGDLDDAMGRKCVCNGLLANVGLGQSRKGGIVEKALVTSGDDAATVHRFLKDGASFYSAADVIKELLNGIPKPASAPTNVTA